MSRYKIQVETTIRYDIEVDADNENEAIARAIDVDLSEIDTRTDRSELVTTEILDITEI